jgi:hypothetical protein
MQIFITGVDTKTLTLNVESTQTVASLKKVAFYFLISA